jgi:hypothetical protein
MAWKRRRTTRWVFLMAPKVRQSGSRPYSDEYLAWDATTTYDHIHAANFETHEGIVEFAQSKGVTVDMMHYPYQVDFDERELRRAS